MEYPQDTDPVQYRRLREMKSALREHGEIHVNYDSREEDLDVRKGTTDFHFDRLEFSVYDGNVREYFHVSNVLSWYKPV